MLLSELKFASFLAYTPRPINVEQEKSKSITDALKNDNMRGEPPQPTSRYLVSVLADKIAETHFQYFFGSEVILVPMPRSTLLLKDMLWVPHRIASALIEYGLGHQVATCLERIKAIPKSASSAPKDRPKAQTHYDSLKVNNCLFPFNRILIVDDVITRGASMIGAASVLSEAFPKAQISGFAMIRTISNTSEFIKIVNPCEGKIILKGDQTYRTP
ncbi:MAG: phosphoribosyltransferase [Candidatus Aminicenantes bacterium]|nr:phosphoribosyltransferase [Candidatus Aminicenantes bacterium]